MFWSGNSTDCLLGPAFEVEVEVFFHRLHFLSKRFHSLQHGPAFEVEDFFHRLHFLSKRFHSLQHGRLKDPHLLLKLDVELITQGIF